MTESEFMREAIEARAREVLEPGEGESVYDRTRHLILPPRPGAYQVTPNSAGDIIEEKYADIIARYKRREAAHRGPTPG